MPDKLRTVKEVASLTGVSIRTLHYYDEINLLKPTHISEAGYRLYNKENLLTLQQILFYRTLGFPLKEIQPLLQSSETDRLTALQTQKQLLQTEQSRLTSLLQTLDNTISHLQGEIEMTDKELFKDFDMEKLEAHQKKHEKEVEERWGDSDAYKESAKKTAKYNKDDWGRIQAEGNAIYAQIADLMDTCDPGAPEVQTQIEAWQNHITKNFYTCTPEILAGLGEMYVADERFTKNIDLTRAGLAEYLRDAIRIYTQQ